MLRDIGAVPAVYHFKALRPTIIPQSRFRATLLPCAMQRAILIRMSEVRELPGRSDVGTIVAALIPQVSDMIRRMTLGVLSSYM